MMTLSATVQVEMAKPKGSDTLRVAGFLDDDETVAVATMQAGRELGTHEVSFPLGDAAHLAERCLAGDERALTTPGLARILAATVALLFRVQAAGGSIHKATPEDAGSHGHRDDRTKAPADEHPGD